MLVWWSWAVSVPDRRRGYPQVYLVAKQCSQRCTPEEYAIALAKHYVKTYPKVRTVALTRGTLQTIGFDAAIDAAVGIQS